MRALVTGGAGFIGSHLVDRLVGDGNAVTVLDNLSTGKRENLNKNAAFTEGDVANAALVQSLVANADAVFHLAAVASVEACERDRTGSHRTNVTGSVAVFDAAARAGSIPIIYASSAAVYGDNPALPLSEDVVTQPLSAYGLDKLSVERYAVIASEAHGVPTVGLRFFNVYGPRQDAASPYSGVISRFVADARSGAPLTFLGDGLQTRDFIAVDDVGELLLKAHACAKQASGAQIYNGCTGHAVSLVELAQAVGNALGKPIKTRYDAPRAGDIRHSCGDPEKARSELGFFARMTLAEGLTKLISENK